MTYSDYYITHFNNSLAKIASGEIKLEAPAAMQPSKEPTPVPRTQLPVPTQKLPQLPSLDPKIKPAPVSKEAAAGSGAAMGALGGAALGGYLGYDGGEEEIDPATGKKKRKSGLGGAALGALAGAGAGALGGGLVGGYFGGGEAPASAPYVSPVPDSPLAPVQGPAVEPPVAPPFNPGVSDRLRAIMDTLKQAPQQPFRATPGK